MSQTKYSLPLFFILLVGLGLRIWDFPTRLSLYSDSARDTVLAQGAVMEKRIPLTGSFSSAGPFVFGPVFYWFIIAIYAIAPRYVFLPFYGIAVLSIVLVWLLADSAKKLYGEKAGLLTGVITAVSPAQVFRAVGLTQHSLVGAAIAAVVWSTVGYITSGKRRWMLICGLAVGTAISLHYQSLGFLVAGGIVLLFKWRKWKQALGDILIYLFGILVVLAPLLYWDYGQGWANIRNLLDYIFIGQYRFFVSRRWLTFGLVFLPQLFGSLVGGYQVFGYLIMAIIAAGVIKLFKERRLPKEIVWLLSILSAQIVILRYSRAELFEGYTIFIHPLIIFLSGWGIFTLIKLKNRLYRFGAYAAAAAIVVSGLISDVRIIFRSSGNNIVSVINNTIINLKLAYPGKKFIPYDFFYRSSEFTYSLSLMLNHYGLIDKEGIPIGVCLNICPPKLGDPIIAADYHGQIYDVIRVITPSNQLPDAGKWNDLSPGNTLKEVGFWWEEKPLTSSFFLGKFLQEKVRMRR